MQEMSRIYTSQGHSLSAWRSVSCGDECPDNNHDLSFLWTLTKLQVLW